MSFRKALAMLVAGITAIFGMGMFHALFGPPVSETEFSPPLPGWFKMLALVTGGFAGQFAYWLVMPKKPKKPMIRVAKPPNS